jgi:predicted TIM-barrel fold metal-dependent hydrolase
MPVSTFRKGRYMLGDLKIVSVDDHVLEPKNVWQDRIPAKYRDRAPRVEKRFGWSPSWGKLIAGDGPGAKWCDVWLYDDLVFPLFAGWAHSRLIDTSLPATAPVTLDDDMYPGCYEQSARLADMDANNVEASLCFPTFTRFCGQTFSEREDKELALLCVQAYNDWMIDEWCAGEGYGRLIPLTLIPLWDVELAAAEVRRCADKGAGAVAFSEMPAALGLPSLYSGAWDPFLVACEETGTVINQHIGSSSQLSTTSPDAPVSLLLTLTTQNAEGALADWLLSGSLARHAGLKIALSESSVGWMPYILERIDRIWTYADTVDPELRKIVPELPSSYMGQVYGCVVDDVHGVKNRDIVGGIGQIMFEVDYPHADSTYPESLRVAEKLVDAAGLNDQEARQLIRGSAIECYNLTRFGLEV